MLIDEQVSGGCNRLFHITNNVCAVTYEHNYVTTHSNSISSPKAQFSCFYQHSFHTSFLVAPDMFFDVHILFECNTFHAVLPYKVYCDISYNYLISLINHLIFFINNTIFLLFLYLRLFLVLLHAFDRLVFCKLLPNQDSSSCSSGGTEVFVLHYRRFDD